MNDTETIGGFKKFIKGANRIIDKISVTTGGAVGFSSSFADEHKLNNYTGVILYWNSENKEIGIQFTTEGEESIKLIGNKYGNGRTANAKAFFAVNHINTENYKGRFPYRVVSFNQLDAQNTSSDKMYIIRLEDHDSQNASVSSPSIVAPNPPAVPDQVAGSETVAVDTNNQPPEVVGA